MSGRTDLEAYLRAPSLENGRTIAARLQVVTTNRSGLGLLFLAKCEAHDGSLGLVISRFPAEEGVVAQELSDGLDVEFIERVFMKNVKAYKSAIYTTPTLSAGLQEGRVIDHQLSGPREMSQYWIRGFLASDLRTTGPFGSRRIADALRTAVNATAKPSAEAGAGICSAVASQSGREGTVPAGIPRSARRF